MPVSSPSQNARSTRWGIERIAGGGPDRRHAERQCRGFNGAQVAFNRRIRIEDDGDAIEARCDLLEQLDPLAGNRSIEIGDAGDVVEAWLSFVASMMTVRVNSRLLPSVSYAMFR
jgi:hypothetical protein